VTLSDESPKKHESTESKTHRRPLAGGEKFANVAIGMSGLMIVGLAWAEYKGYTVEGAWRKEFERYERDRRERLKNAQAYATRTPGSERSRRFKTAPEDGPKEQAK
jgi:hypothetical protein